MKYGEKEVLEFDIQKEENYWPNDHSKNYTINIDHATASTSDAYNVVIADTLPTGLTYAGNLTFTGTTPDSQDVSGAPLSFTYDTLTLLQDASVSFDVTLDANIEAGRTVINPAVVNYNTTDTTNPDSQAQTQVTDSASFTTAVPVLTKTIDRTSFDYTSGTDVAIGEKIF